MNQRARVSVGFLINYDEAQDDRQQASRQAAPKQGKKSITLANGKQVGIEKDPESRKYAWDLLEAGAKDIPERPLIFGRDDFTMDCINGVLGPTMRTYAAKAFPISQKEADEPNFEEETADRASKIMRYLRGKSETWERSFGLAASHNLELQKTLSEYHAYVINLNSYILADLPERARVGAPVVDLMARLRGHGIPESDIVELLNPVHEHNGKPRLKVPGKERSSQFERREQP